MKKKPFVNQALNDLETYSLASSMITIYCGLFFISDKAGEVIMDAKSQLILSEEVKLLFFVVIVTVNILYLIFWLYKVYQEMKLIIILKFSKVYLVFCLCFNNQKLEKIKKQAQQT
eukprot:CAMPEP_0170551212 /NCGR_PEP_ID=MMETSP0211-20121228/9250_1 /TAXON_ID=311385 /ORGANISM="Pseudokeronopsis sp., Strain OXSARD2" /LENGTH=115 /DNA_ID=CAMNT_0010858261 /DNA_START=1465 /DNA_END=1812 /DNA_ORIENTATION=+